MHFSICLSMGFEGVMYPIPFSRPQDFAAQAQLCERLGYHSVWGNDHITTQGYVREKFPGRTPNFYEPLITLAMCAQATDRIKLGTALNGQHTPGPQIPVSDRDPGNQRLVGVGGVSRAGRRQ